MAGWWFLGPILVADCPSICTRSRCRDTVASQSKRSMRSAQTALTFTNPYQFTTLPTDQQLTSLPAYQPTSLLFGVWMRRPTGWSLLFDAENT
jgi:hypothetical protein